MAMETDVFLKSASTLGARAFNKIAMARSEKLIQEFEGGTSSGVGKKKPVGNVGTLIAADGSNCVVEHED